MKKDSWDSQYRKKRFYEKQAIKALKKENQAFEKDSFISVLRSEPKVIPKSIAIMLDLDGTSNWMNESSAEIFMKQIDLLRKRFGNQKAYICISTHSSTPNNIKKVLDELNKFATDGIILGYSFYYGGLYDYQTDVSYYRSVPFNLNKIETFSDFYLNDENLNIGWFAIADDSLTGDVIKEYQYSKPMVGLKPVHYSKKDNNFMFRSTDTDNIMGVIELLDDYIKDTQDMDYDDVLEKQRKMVIYISPWECNKLIQKRQFDILFKYLQSDIASKEDCKGIYNWLVNENSLTPFESMYQSYIVKILGILSEKGAFDESIEDVKKLFFDRKEM